MNTSTLKIILLLVFIVKISQCRITHRSIDKDYRNLIELETPFGFIETGTVEIVVSDVDIVPISPQIATDYRGLGFFIIKAEDESTLLEVHYF